MAFARPGLSRLPGLRFYKLCGTGVGEGFTPIPNTAVYAILAVWDSEDQAREQTTKALIFQAYRKQAEENWTLYLRASSSRGRWSQQEPFQPDGAPLVAPIAALTRATIKPSILWQFWKRVPAISDVIGSDPNVAFKIGMGEVPWLHQVTFSIWPDLDSMAQFARKPGPHAHAIKAVRDGHWFQEELYARFQVVGDEGSWEGRRPLSNLMSQTRPVTVS